MGSRERERSKKDREVGMELGSLEHRSACVYTLTTTPFASTYISSLAVFLFYCCVSFCKISFSCYADKESSLGGNDDLCAGSGLSSYHVLACF